MKANKPLAVTAALTAVFIVVTIIMRLTGHSSGISYFNMIQAGVAFAGVLLCTFFGRKDPNFMHSFLLCDFVIGINFVLELIKVL
ncbi:MAG: hypothetical protein Q4E74_01940 [Ruminococcus sp.]|nr:hypothetical protein [Ruminococcus sp.]